MRPSQFLFGSILFLILLPLSISAQKKDTIGVSDMFEMSFEDLLDVRIISASRAQENPASAAGSVIVIPKEIILQRGYRNLGEALEDVPGVDFTTRQPAGEYPTHFLFRGISDVGQTNLLIMVDGIIQNDISNGWFRGMGFDFPMIDVERIEIIYGPGSSLYGANAYAGLIHIITSHGEESKLGHFADIRFSAGTYSTLVPELIYRYKSEKGLTVQLAGQWYSTVGDQGLDRLDPGNYFHNNYEPDSVLTTEYGLIANERNPDGSRKSIPDGFSNSIDDKSARILIAYNGFELGLSWSDRIEGLGSEVMGYEYFANTPGLDYLAHHSGKTMYTSYSFSPAENFDSKTILSVRNTRIHPETGFYYTYKYQSVDNGINAEVYDKKKGYSGDGYLTRLEQQFNLSVKDWNRTVFGFHIENQIRQYFGISLGPQQDASSTIVGSNYTSEEESIQPMYFSNSVGLYLHDEVNWKDKLKLTGGLRYDYDSDYGNVLIPRLALVSTLSDKFHAKILYGQAFRAPTIFELFDEWRGNTNLQPQRIGTSEIEFGYRKENKMGIRANLFYNQVYSMIIEAPNPDPIVVPIGPNGEKATYFQNIGEFAMMGFSVIGDFSPHKNIMLSANYSYNTGLNDVVIDHIAMHKANFIVNCTPFRWLNVNLRANYIGKVRAPETNLYFYPKTEESIAQVGYDYVTEDDPDGFVQDFCLMNMTLTFKNLFKSAFGIQPQLVVRNLLNTQYIGVGRQSGSGLRPVDQLQALINNPLGFIPAYHPQAGREIYLRIILNIN